MLVNTANLSGLALHFAVAKVQGFTYRDFLLVEDCLFTPDGGFKGPMADYRPSEQGHEGWPLIEAFDLDLARVPGGWQAATPDGQWQAFGETRLIAAMRCIVLQGLGVETEIPEKFLV